MTPPAPSGIRKAALERGFRREARAELLSGLLFIGVAAVILAGVALLERNARFQTFPALRIAFLLYAALLALFAVLARHGRWHASLGFVNSTLQVAIVSAYLMATVHERGGDFALSSSLPMMFCLVIALTAFRLNPGLCLFAGVLSALALTLQYAFFIRAGLSPEALFSNPTIAWPGIYSRAMILLATGAASAFAARALHRQIRHREEDQSRIHLLERTFGRLVAPEVARQILENKDWMKPARREAVVMFADLRGFTQFSEGRAPEEIAGFLNNCWSVAAGIVERHGGVINKYLGDGFLAIFGVPLEIREAEEAAAATAAELERELTPLLQPDGLALCIGLHAGPMIVGAIGSEDRCEFTVIGSTVNLASRIETLNRSLSTRCLASQDVAEKISHSWRMKPRGEHQVKGVSQGVSVFELEGQK